MLGVSGEISTTRHSVTLFALSTRITFIYLTRRYWQHRFDRFLRIPPSLDIDGPPTNYSALLDSVTIRPLYVVSVEDGAPLTHSRRWIDALERRILPLAATQLELGLSLLHAMISQPLERETDIFLSPS